MIRVILTKIWQQRKSGDRDADRHTDHRETALETKPETEVSTHCCSLSVLFLLVIAEAPKDAAKTIENVLEDGHN